MSEHLFELSFMQSGDQTTQVSALYSPLQDQINVKANFCDCNSFEYKGMKC